MYGWGCTAGTPEPLANTRPRDYPYPRVVIFQKFLGLMLSLGTDLQVNLDGQFYFLEFQFLSFPQLQPIDL